MHTNQKRTATDPLAGLVYCAACGKKMHYCRYDERNHGTPKHRAYFQCPDYDASRNREIKRCASNHITSSILRPLVEETIRAVCRAVAFDEQAFRKLLARESRRLEPQSVKEMKKRVSKAQKRVAELDLLLKKLYEDYALGKISEERFDKLAPGYEAEQSKLKETLTADQAKLNEQQDDAKRLDQFLALAAKYRDSTEVTDEMIRAFIDKVMVHHIKIDANGQRTRQIDTHFSFVGKIDLSGATTQTDSATTA